MLLFCLCLAQSAKASVLSSLACVHRELFSICNNGCIPNLKLVSALLNSHKKSRIYHHGEEPLEWTARAGGMLRMCAKHWRDLAMNEDKYEVCMRKAGGLQTTNRSGHFSKDFRTLGFRGE